MADCPGTYPCWPSSPPAPPKADPAAERPRKLAFVRRRKGSNDSDVTINVERWPPITTPLEDERPWKLSVPCYCLYPAWGPPQCTTPGLYPPSNTQRPPAKPRARQATARFTRTGKCRQSSPNTDGSDDDESSSKTSNSGTAKSRAQRTESWVYLDGHNTSPSSSSNDDAIDTKRTTRIKIHFCHRCGRYRSRRFHRANPVFPGGLPIIGLCSRCLPNNLLLSNPWCTTGRMVGERLVGEYVVRRRVASPLRAHGRSPAVSTKRRRHSSSPNAKRRDRRGGKRARSSESFTRIKVKRQRSGDSSDESSLDVEIVEKRPAAKAPKAKPAPRVPQEKPEPRPIILIERHVRSDVSKTRVENDDRRTAAELRRSEIDRRIASHPNAWSHGRMIPKEREPQEIHIRDVHQRKTPTSAQSPEYTYRHVLRQSFAPSYRASPPERQIRAKPTDPRDFHDRTAATRRPAETKRPTSPLRRARPGPPPRASTQAPRRRELDDVEPRTPIRRPPPQRHSSEDSPHVRFASGTKGMDAVRRQDEAVRDWSQAERDEREFDDRKRRVRNVVYQGGRGFEIDGNCDLFRDEAHNAESAACDPDDSSTCDELPPLDSYTKALVLSKDATLRRPRSLYGYDYIYKRSVSSAEDAGEFHAIETVSEGNKSTGPDSRHDEDQKLNSTPTTVLNDTPRTTITVRVHRKTGSLGSQSAATLDGDDVDLSDHTSLRLPASHAMVVRASSVPSESSDEGSSSDTSTLSGSSDHDPSELEPFAVGVTDSRGERSEGTW